MSYRRAFSAFYGRNFERRPWVTLAVTNGLLGVIADGAAQTLERISQRQSAQDQLAVTESLPPSQPSTETTAPAAVSKEWDWSRSSRFLVFNVGMAPLLAEWNRFLEFRFPLRGATTAVAGAAATAGKVSLQALGKRLAMDQILL